MHNTKAIWVLRIAVAGEFIGHGVFALQGKKDWVEWFAQFGVSDPTVATQLLFILGIIDITLAVLVLVRPVRLALLSERVVAVSINSLIDTSCLHRPVVFRKYRNERGEKASPFLSGAIPKAPVTGACLLLLSPAPLPQTRVPLRPWRNNRRCEYGKEGVRFQTAHRGR